VRGVTLLPHQVTAGVAVKNCHKEKTLQQKGRRSEENVFGTFMYIFFILVMRGTLFSIDRWDFLPIFKLTSFLFLAIDATIYANITMEF
jgi:hypothetical protein